MEEIVFNTLLRLQRGDVEALRAVYMMYASKVREFACRMLGNETDAEDVTHDVFLKVWEYRRNIDKVESLDGYLFRMTRNTILNLFKHRAVKSRYNSEIQLDTPPR